MLTNNSICRQITNRNGVIVSGYIKVNFYVHASLELDENVEQYSNEPHTSLQIHTIMARDTAQTDCE